MRPARSIAFRLGRAFLPLLLLPLYTQATHSPAEHVLADAAEVPLVAARRHSAARAVRVAVLDFGVEETGRRAADRMARSLSSEAVDKSALRVTLVDREQGRTAARGNGYTGSLNMTLSEARDLGASIGCDFFLTGEAQTLRRSPSEAPAYYESYASLFIVSARTGRLLLWERPSIRAAEPEKAERALLEELHARAAGRYLRAIFAAYESEETERRARAARASGADVGRELEDLTGDEAVSESADLRLPQPFRRLQPVYTEAAAEAEVAATVDALVEIEADGRVGRVEIVRWAGYGLDESVSATVRQLHFRPAMRRGQPKPSRVLLRYNFRRQPKTGP